MSITAKLETRSLQDAMRDTIVLGRRSSKSVVMSTAIFFTQSARKLTPAMRKGRRRDIEPNPDRTATTRGLSRTEQRGAKWRIVVRHQNRPDTYILTNDKNDPRRIIRTGGVAKNSWNGTLKKLNRQGKAIQSGRGVRLGSALVKLRGDDPHVVITNRTEYLSKIAPGIEHHAMIKARNRMDNNLDSKMKRELEKLWT